MYLLDLFVSGHRPLLKALLLEPGADGLQGAVSAAPAVVIHPVLHVVVIAVDSLDQVHLQKRENSIKVSIRCVFPEETECDMGINRTFPSSTVGCVRARWGLRR